VARTENFVRDTEAGIETGIEDLVLDIEAGSETGETEDLEFDTGIATGTESATEDHELDTEIEVGRTEDLELDTGIGSGIETEAENHEDDIDYFDIQMIIRKHSYPGKAGFLGFLCLASDNADGSDIVHFHKL